MFKTTTLVGIVATLAILAIVCLTVGHIVTSLHDSVVEQTCHSKGTC